MTLPEELRFPVLQKQEHLQRLMGCLVQICALPGVAPVSPSQSVLKLDMLLQTCED